MGSQEDAALAAQLDALVGYVKDGLAQARANVEKAKQAAGRSERGRHLALVATKVEEALLWLDAGKVL